jgi:hypothetical protein
LVAQIGNQKKESSQPAQSEMEGHRVCRHWQQKKEPMADALLGVAQERPAEKGRQRVVSAV